MKINESIWDDFTNQYSLSKTLRFELKPVGKTAEYINKNNILIEDKERMEDFKKVKVILDDYYKNFMEEVLGKIEINPDLLNQYYDNYNSLKKMKKSDGDYKNQLKIFKEINTELRKSIHKIISSDPIFKDLFKAEILKEISLWLKENERDEDFTLINKFDKWGTYFVGFFENRKNVFSLKEIPTSLIYRIVNDNLPKYIDNLENYNKLINEFPSISFENIENDLKEELNGKSLNEFFNLNNFNSCLNQSGIDNYNTVIGGKFIQDKREKIKGVNEYINLYSQKINEKNISKKVRRMKLIVLFKQILSEKKSHSFVLDKFEDDSQLILSIKDFSENIINAVDIDNKKIIDKIKLLCDDFNYDKYDFEKIYIKSDLLKTMSVSLYGDYSFIQSAMNYYSEKLFPMPAKVVKKIEKEREVWVNKSYHSVEDIEKALAHYTEYLGNDSEFKKLSFIDYAQPIRSYFASMTITINKEIIDINKKINESYETLQPILNKEYKKDEKNILNDEESIEKIKNYLDSINFLINFLNPLYVFIKSKDESNILDKDSLFYGDFDILFNDLRNNGNKLYNKVRNYVTQKPYSVKKYKLNFDNSTLLKGWDYNKVINNWSIILRKDDYYYLVVLTNDSKHLFTDTNFSVSNNNYEMVNYKLVSDASKMLPKIFIKSDKGLKKYSPSKEILTIYENEEFKKGDNFNLESCHKLIDYYKKHIPSYKVNETDTYGWEVFNYHFSPTHTYKDLSDFYKEVNEQSYKIWFEKISEEYINKLVDEGEIYLFKIWNKDFSNFSKGKKNLHTYYWKMIFNNENLKNPIYKLNGEAEIFYREASIPRKITHPKDVLVVNKDPINNKKTSSFKYDLIKDRRYSENKFFFYCPITLNFRSHNNTFVNEKIKDKIYKNDNINILSIDRGERHLLYYTLLDGEGNILKQNTLNILKDDVFRNKDFKNKLVQKEEKRDMSRKTWKNIENIKELKEGYLSQVIHNVATLAIENNAIIVLENLNFGFKRGRFKIERQVYQKFEKTLIEKLNYFVIKDKEINSSGGLLKAYQLTNQFDSFTKLGDQSGIIFYIPAQFTSKIDPKTGFVNMLYPKYETIIQSKEFLEKFKYIKYNKLENMFEFNFNYSDFDSKKELKLIRDNWSIWSNGTRLITKRDPNKNHNWITQELNLTEELKKLFESYNINYLTEKDFKQEFNRIDKKEFFEKLIYLLRNVLQLRNSYTESEINKLKNNPNFNESDYDYILSCVKDKNGNFFDSRKAKSNEPLNADANGAFNIGMKGLMVIDGIRKGEKSVKIDRNNFINFIIKRNE